MKTLTLLPASRWMPATVSRVPPDTGPLSGRTWVRVGVWRKTDETHTQLTQTHSITVIHTQSHRVYMHTDTHSVNMHTDYICVGFTDTHHTHSNYYGALMSY